MTGCALEGLGGCSGRLEKHHVCEKRWLKDKFPHGAVWNADRGSLVPLSRLDSVPDGAEVTLADLLADERNLILVCGGAHHQHITNRRVYLTELPFSVQVFADEVGLAGRLEKQRERAA